SQKSRETHMLSDDSSYNPYEVGGRRDCCGKEQSWYGTARVGSCRLLQRCSSADGAFLDSYSEVLSRSSRCCWGSHLSGMCLGSTRKRECWSVRSWKIHGNLECTSEIPHLFRLGF